MKTRVSFTLRLPEDILPFVDTVAHSLGTSRNSAIILIIRQYLAEHPEPTGVPIPFIGGSKDE